MPGEEAAGPSFAALLRRHRREAGLTQEGLAERAGLSARAVSDLERDDGRVPRRDSLDLLLGALALAAEERAAVERAVARARAAAQPEQGVFPAPPEGGARETLSAQPTAFIGREREIAAVRERLLDPETHLLTLTGPGGMGKTRLALQVAAAVADRFPDGVAFVPLAPITDPALVLPAVAQALGVAEVARQPIQATLAFWLRGRRLLLVLDNFEQVLPAATAVQDLLAAAAGVTVLVTSRSALRLRGERTHLVAPLAVPTPPLPPLEALSQYEAVRLFIDRARDVSPGFAVTNETAPAVAGICARLDGLPLAIELVAARSRMLAPEALLGRLGERLRLATGGARDLPDRQRTLRAAIDWSHDLLGPEERTLFARLAVFSGGRTLEAVEAVCDPGGELATDVLDGVESLLDKSLLRREEGPGGEPRIAMLETIHEYARERLEASGERATLADRHLAYYLALAERAEIQIRSGDDAAWYQRLEAERDNLRAALHWGADGHGDPAAALGLATALRRFWAARSAKREGAAWLESALSTAHGAPAALRARALNAAGVMSLDIGDHGRAQAQFEESLTLRRGLGDRQGISASIGNLGYLALAQCDYERARALLEESLAMDREDEDRPATSSALLNLGQLAVVLGDYGRARLLHEESLAISRELGSSGGQACALVFLGVVAVLRADYPHAEVLFAEGHARAESLGWTWEIAFARVGRGKAAFARGDLAGARVLTEEGLALFREDGDRQMVADALNHLWLVALAQGDRAAAGSAIGEAISLARTLPDRLATAQGLEGRAMLRAAQGDMPAACRLFGAAAALREELGAAMEPYKRPWYERAVGGTRATLGVDAFAAAYAAGRALPLEEAIRLALE